MKKRHETVESLLTSGKGTGLSASERAGMWQELHAYATFHAPANESVVPRKRFSYIAAMRLATASMAVLFVSVGTGYASFTSLPGETLYPVKVHIVEPVLGLSQTSEQDRLNYQASLLERRLFEMKELDSAKQLNEETMVTLESQVAEHGSEINKIIVGDSDTSIASKERLEVLSDAVATLRTYEHIEDTKVSKERKSKFETTEDSVSALFATEAARFADTEPSEAVEYIADVIEELDTNLTEDAIASSTVTEVNDFLEDAETALSEGDVDRALQFTEEAKQVVDLDIKTEEILEEDTTPSS